MSTNLKVEGPFLDKMCRLCLKEDGGIIEIFDASENLSLPLRIMACASLEVQQSDLLPKLICWECRVQLEKSYLFRKRCKKSDDKLRRHIRLINAGKKSRVFQKNEGNEDDDDEDEFEESLIFLNKIEEDERKHREDERAELEEKLKEKFRIEETERIFEEAKSYLNSRASHHQQSTSSQSNNQQCKVKKLKKEHIEICEKSEASQESQANSVTSDEEMLESNAENSNYSYPEIFKVTSTDGKDSFIEDNDDELQSTYYVIKNIDNENEDDNDQSNEDADENLVIADYHRTVNVNEDDEQIQTISLDDCTFDEISNQNAIVEQNEQRDEEDEEEEYLQESEAQVIVNEEHKTLSLSDALQKTLSSSDNSKSILKNKYNVEKVSDKVLKITSTDEKNVYVMEIHANMPDTEDIIEKDVSGSQELKIFKCQDCPQTFTRRSLLLRHKSVHVKNKGYSCEFCEKWFACKSSLDRHTRVHTGEKPFQCDQCHRRFIQKEILKRHMVIHTGIKPHKCTYCDKSFVQKQLLLQHINLKHTENPIIKMHKCFLCPKTFYHASGLSRHLLIHSGVSFSCKICHKKFNDKSAVKRHTMTVHSALKSIKLE